MTGSPSARVRRGIERLRPPWLATVRVLLAGHLSLGHTLARRPLGRRPRAWPAVLGGLLLVGVGGWAVGAFHLVRAMHLALTLAGQPLGVPVMAVLGGQLLVLVFGTVFVITSLFFATDLPRMLALPLRPVDIVGARLAGLYLDMLLLTALAVGPALAACGSVVASEASAGFGSPAATGSAAAAGSTAPGPGEFPTPVRFTGDPVFWLSGVAIWLLLPVVPLALATAVGVAVGRGTALVRHRDALYIGGSLVGLAVALGYQYINFQLVPKLDEPEALARVLQTPNALILRAVAAYPPARWAAEALMGPAGAVAAGTAERAGLLGAFALFSAAVAAPALALAGRWYLFGVQAGLEEPICRRVAVAGAAGAPEVGGAAARLLAGPARTQVAALALREWRVLWRTPPFMLPAVTNALAPPLVLVMMAWFSPWRETLAEASRRLDPAWVAAAIGAVGVFMAGASQIAATSVSREGRGFSQTAALPISPARHVAARLLVAAPFTVLTAVLVAGCAWAALRAPAPVALGGLALGLVGSWPALAGSLWIDLARPNTVWENPQQAMKGNINSLWSMLLALAALGAAAGPGWLLLRAGVSLRFALVTGGAILVALGAAATLLCLRQAEQLLGDAGELS